MEKINYEKMIKNRIKINELEINKRIEIFLKRRGE
jgi:hypothetical protein